MCKVNHFQYKFGLKQFTNKYDCKKKSCGKVSVILNFAPEYFLFLEQIYTPVDSITYFCFFQFGRPLPSKFDQIRIQVQNRRNLFTNETSRILGYYANLFLWKTVSLVIPRQRID